MNEIELSDDVLVPCPDKGFAYRKVKFCLSCSHYKGIAKATLNGIPIDGDESDAYQIICGRPITRKLIKICED